MSEPLAEWLMIPAQEREKILEWLRVWAASGVASSSAAAAAIAVLDADPVAGPDRAAEPGSGPPPPRP